jgi:hypothetical protein
MQFVTTAVVIPGTFALFGRLGKIRDHLAELNGSVRELNQWRIDHTDTAEHDAKHHVLTREQCQALHAERLSSVHRQLDALYQRLGDRSQGERATD